MCPGPSGVMSWACRPAYWTFRVSAWPPAGGLVPRVGNDCSFVGDADHSQWLYFDTQDTVPAYTRKWVLACLYTRMQIPPAERGLENVAELFTGRNSYFATCSSTPTSPCARLLT